MCVCRLCVPLVCAGPYKVNGVPLRRLNQAYVITTSKTVDISGVKLPESVNDKFFVATEEAKKAKSEAAFFTAEEGVKVRCHACVHLR
jgi:large subunit ribosomal protein L6e